MKKFKRVFTIVIDSAGVGYMPDAYKYGDEGANTFKHIAEKNNGLVLPTLHKLGLYNLVSMPGMEPNNQTIGYYTKMMEASLGKDTMTGHWEIMGLYIDKPFITFTEHGFPQELVDELEKQTGYKYIGNKAASGTEILDELGPRHIETKELILYTSADSVLQIAASEEVIGLDELYRCCQIARDITMKDEWKVGRVIARPFVGKEKGRFTRTANRHDYALKPFGKTVLDSLKENNYDVISVGKIKDIFDGEGITDALKSKSSVHGMEQTIELLDRDFNGLVFTNLVDFDAKWGHRRDPIGYANELIKFDEKLATFIEGMQDHDLLIVTADHGNDPTWTGTDHTREMVPLFIYSKSFTGSGLLPIRETFADLGATIADNFDVENPGIGKSVLDLLK